MTHNIKIAYDFIHAQLPDLVMVTHKTHVSFRGYGTVYVLNVEKFDVWTTESLGLHVVGYFNYNKSLILRTSQ